MTEQILSHRWSLREVRTDSHLLPVVLFYSLFSFLCAFHLLLCTHPVSLPFLPRPLPLLWCGSQQHSCLEQSARADICRTVSLIRSVARSIGVMKSSSRQSRHRGRQSERALAPCFWSLCFSVLLKFTLPSAAHAPGVLSCLLSVCGASVIWTVVALSQTGLAASHVFPIKLSLQTQVQRAGRNVGFIRLFVSCGDVQLIWKEDFWQLHWLSVPGAFPLMTKPMTEWIKGC